MADEINGPRRRPAKDTGRTSRLKQRFGGGQTTEDGRPKSVYIILFVGVAALVILLFVVYLSSDRSIPDQPICSTISVDQAQASVLEGRMRGITIAYDDTAEPPSALNWGPVLVRLSYTDGQCANLPQGIMQQDRLYQLIGTITMYNDVTENQKVEIKYDRSTELSESLFHTPTPLPTPEPDAGPTPTEEPTPAITPAPTAPGMIGPTLNFATPESAP